MGYWRQRRDFFLCCGRAGRPEGRVLAVEADTWLVGLLRRSARASGRDIAPVDVLAMAVSEAVGVSRLT